MIKSINRQNLLEAGIELVDQNYDEHTALKKKIQAMRERNLSYQVIADIFNIWKIATLTGKGKWHSKTVREIERNSL